MQTGGAAHGDRRDKGVVRGATPRQVGFIGEPRTCRSPGTAGLRAEAPETQRAAGLGFRLAGKLNHSTEYAPWPGMNPARSACHVSTAPTWAGRRWVLAMQSSGPLTFPFIVQACWT